MCEFVKLDQVTKLYSPTKLGFGIVNSSFEPNEGMLLYDQLLHGTKEMCLDSDLHLVYHLTPIKTDIEPVWSNYLHVYMGLHEKFLRVANKVQVSKNYIEKSRHVLQ